MEVSPHDPRRRLLRLAVRAPHARRRRPLGDASAPILRRIPKARRAPAANRSRATRRAKRSTARCTRFANRRVQKGVIWAGSNDGLIHVTRDDGKTWTNVTPKDLPPGGRVQNLEPGAASRRHRVRRDLPLPARRLRALHLPHRRFRQDLDPAHRWQERHRRRRAHARGARRSRIAPACCMPAPNSACTFPSTTARTGRAFQLNLPNTPVTDIKVAHKDLICPRRAAASGFSIT